ncbi:hypothetical protein FKW77_001655 [Venturia effusa]|uniref:Heterokaryon incompatibility domain-containing protein n=1 Tax=Venturia effusa TaxID=50376 RepID=A0A517L8N0_9PEZI|nr:hypothetical protein FKW77_001655 [Venturia effusa]
MLCAQCRERLFAADKPWGLHHQVKTIRECALADCLVCTRLKDDIDDSKLELGDSEDGENITHRWTIRLKTQTRDQNTGLITITFRSVLPESALPTRVFYLLDEKGIPNLPNPDAMPKNTMSSLEQLDKWLDECHKNHPRCQQTRQLRLSEARFVPTRLIELTGPNEESGRLRLVETKNWSSHTPLEPYMTLSHCWGETETFKMFKTVPENVGQFLDNIDLDKMPKTFRNVIGLAWRLEIQYVWIDSICVIQGDNGDFGSEAHHMHSVYRHSYLNVAAAASPNGDGGLYSERSPREIASTPLNVEESEILGNKSWLLLPGDMWARQLLQEPLYKRGWVFQERLLSPRLVHFGSKQVFWDCATKSACEVFPNGVPEPLDIDSATERRWRERLQRASMIREGRDLVGEADVSIETLWRTAISNYTTCALTKSTDKLIACWSIAKLVRDMLDNERYAVGMWSFNLHKQLSWRVLNYSKSKRIYDVAKGRVPSWSWASIHGKLQELGCPVLLPPRLGNPADDNVYSITGHGGLPLTFRLREERDVFKAENEQPVLEDLKLAVLGHVFRTHIRPTQGGYTMDMVDGSRNRDKVTVFPDLQPAPAGDDGLVTFRESMTDGANRGKNFGMVTDAKVENGLHFGRGLILKCVEAQSRPIFQRTGAFKFENLNEREWRHLTTTDHTLTETSQHESHGQGVELWLK